MQHCLLKYLILYVVRIVRMTRYENYDKGGLSCIVNVLVNF